MKIDRNTFEETDLRLLKKYGVRFNFFISKAFCPFDKAYRDYYLGIKPPLEKEEALMRFFWLKLLTVD